MHFLSQTQQGSQTIRDFTIIFFHIYLHIYLSTSFVNVENTTERSATGRFWGGGDVLTQASKQQRESATGNDTKRLVPKRRPCMVYGGSKWPSSSPFDILVWHVIRCHVTTMRQ